VLNASISSYSSTIELYFPKGETVITIDESDVNKLELDALSFSNLATLQASEGAV